MRPVLLAAAVATALVAGGPSAHAAPGVRIYQSSADRSITEGETVIEGDPADVYAEVLDFSRWTVIFPDVLQVVITEQKGNDARVTLIGPNDHHDNLHFKNQPQARMIFFEDTGGHADVWAEIMFLPADQPHTTRVHTRLYADVHGVASLVVSGGDVRRMRELKIERDLVHIREYFKRRASVVRL